MMRGNNLFLAVGSNPHSSQVRWVRRPLEFLGRKFVIADIGLSSIGVDTAAALGGLFD